jgi:hypothetical protein
MARKRNTGPSQEFTSESVMNPTDTGNTGGTTNTLDGTTPFTPMNVFTSEIEQKKFSDYIITEIVDVRDGSDRKGLEERWVKWRKQRIASVDSEVRETPWIRSANVEPPLTMQKVQMIFAKLVAAYSIKKPPVEVTALSKSDSETADSLERFFKALAENRYGLDVSRKFKQIAYDLVSMGTQVVKVPFKVEQWSFKRTGTTGSSEQVTYLKHKGPEIVPIRLEDFFTRPYWKDVQRAPWVAVRYKYFFHELKLLESQGFFEDVTKVLGSSLTAYDENLISALDSAGIPIGVLHSADANREYELYECNVFWDVDGDGYPEDVIAWVEPTSGAVLRTQFNPLSLRDIEVMNYLENPDSMYGIGVCQMLESLQEEASALHRMRLDGTQLSMMKMFIGRRGCGIGPNEKFQPFKLLLVDDPKADFIPIEFPDITNGCILSENMVKDYADRVTGSNDYVAGFNDKTVGSNATFSGMSMLAQQSNSILNSLMENTSQGMSSIYMMALYQCIANKDLLELDYLSEEDQLNIATVLSLKVEELPTKFRFNVRTTDIDKTDESKKQNYLMVMQMYSQYLEKAMTLVQLKASPQLAQMPEALELVNSVYVGMTTLMGKIFEFFDVGNADDFLPFVEQLKVQLQQVDKIREQQVNAIKGSMRNAAGNGGPINGTVSEVPSSTINNSGLDNTTGGTGMPTAVPTESLGPTGTGPNGGA